MTSPGSDPSIWMSMERKSFDYIVTLCDDAAKTCPLFPGEGKRMHKGFPDPAAAEGSREERLAVFRKVRDELKEYILSFSSD